MYKICSCNEQLKHSCDCSCAVSMMINVAQECAWMLQEVMFFKHPAIKSSKHRYGTRRLLRNGKLEKIPPANHHSVKVCCKMLAASNHGSPALGSVSFGEIDWELLDQTSGHASHLLNFENAVEGICAGYRVSGTHANPLGIKTDAPFHIIWDIVRAWVAEHPVKPQDPASYGEHNFHPTLPASSMRLLFARTSITIKVPPQALICALLHLCFFVNVSFPEFLVSIACTNMEDHLMTASTSRCAAAKETATSVCCEIAASTCAKICLLNTLAPCGAFAARTQRMEQHQDHPAALVTNVS